MKCAAEENNESRSCEHKSEDRKSGSGGDQVHIETMRVMNQMPERPASAGTGSWVSIREN